MEKKSIGSFIAALRKSNGMTQQGVADRLNVSNKTVSKWERDESYPEITLIPVIAELFNVTSDDILRGEKIYRNEATADGLDIKIDKQMKRIISSNITKFKNISYIALALVFTGVIFLFTISYGFYRPILAYGIFLIFITASILLEVIQLNTTNTSIKDNDIFEGKEELLITIKNSMKKYALMVFIVDAIAFVFSSPFILIRDSRFPTSVLSLGSYLMLIPILVISSCIISDMINLIIGTLIQKDVMASDMFPYKKMSSMNIIHVVLLVVEYILFFVKETVETAQTGMQSSGYLSPFALFLAPIIILVSIFIFIVKGCNKNEKIIIAVAALRNLLNGFIGLYLVLYLISRKSPIPYVSFPMTFVFIMWLGAVITILYEIIKHRIYYKN